MTERRTNASESEEMRVERRRDIMGTEWGVSVQLSHIIVKRLMCKSESICWKISQCYYRK